ncbi:MAG: MaoC/PaaZ C-terminal domain-containing protein [Syntrophales bacterium]|jgi:acyl dehydratase
MSEIRAKTTMGLRAGDSFTTTRTFTEEDVSQYGEMIRDYNPVHYEEDFATVKKLKGRICHGLLVAGLCTEIGGQIAWFASGMNHRFKHPVYIGDTVTCRFTIREMHENGRARADLLYVNQRGETVMTGEIWGYIPTGRDRDVLAAIVKRGDVHNKLRSE